MIIIGDIHAKVYDLTDKIERYDLRDENIILLGDVGVGFEGFADLKEYSNKFVNLNTFLNERKIMTYVVRGNHDNPHYFDGRNDYENIIFVQDYSVLNIEDKNILFIGGAISIDRSARDNGRSYWDNENFVLDPPKVEKLKNIDAVVSHSAPNFVEPISFGSQVNYWAQIEADFSGKKDKWDLKKELSQERLFIAYIYNTLKCNKNPLSHWFYSHFHFSNRQTVDKIEFVLLDIDEWYTF